MTTRPPRGLLQRRHIRGRLPRHVERPPCRPCRGRSSALLPVPRRHPTRRLRRPGAGVLSSARRKTWIAMRTRSPRPRRPRRSARRRNRRSMRAVSERRSGRRPRAYVVIKTRICERISPISILTSRTKRGGEFVGRYVVGAGLKVTSSNWPDRCSVTLSAGCATGSALRGGVRVHWVGDRCARSALFLFTSHTRALLMIVSVVAARRM